MNPNGLFDRVFGCLLGGAIGDAIGGPVECWHYKAIRKKFGTLDRFIEYPKPRQVGTPGNPQKLSTPGIYTDDTVMKHLLCLAIIDNNGHVGTIELGKAWVKYLDLGIHQVWKNAQVTLHRLKLLGTSPDKTGEGNIPCDDAAMSISPIGLLNFANPKQAALEAYFVSTVFQEGYSKSAASAVASAVAETMNPESTIDSVVQQAAMYCGDETKKAIDRAIDVAKKCKDHQEFTEKAYEKLLVNNQYWASYKEGDEEHSFSADPLEVMPVSLGMFYVCKGDPKLSIIAGANFGRDCDTIGGIAGGIAGAFKGAKEIPADWIETSCKVNPYPDMKEIATKLTEIIEQDVRAGGERIKVLEAMRGK